MSFDKIGSGALDYALCTYGSSKLRFRGPKRRVKGDFIAFLGGTETYGKFVPKPFPALIERDLGIPCVNFGWVNAGVDVFCNDPTVLDRACDARLTVVQVMGAQNMSNRFYMVHPRRNDRFVSASAMMQKIFPEVDFTEFHFTRHMLTRLSKVAPERFMLLRDELQQAWVARMRLLLNTIRGQKVLLWVANHSPDQRWDEVSLGPDPLFIERDMLEQLRRHVEDIVEVKISDQARMCGTEGMICSEMEVLAAEHMLGPIAHREAAHALGLALDGIIH